jgi:transposase InsO family protein
MAVFRQKPADGLTHHSDRGVQYASEDYQNLLDEFDIECSMSRKGNCLDNAPMESFFGTLKTESLRRASFDTEEQAKNRIFTYIERFYNRKRRHSALDYMSPAEYEKNDESLAA